MKRAKQLLLTILTASCLYPAAAGAQGINPDSKKPLEITAQESLEWNRTEKFFKARKTVIAKQGETTLKADTLTAKYRDEKGGGMKIYRIEADGHVIIESAASKAYGDHAVYTVDDGLAVLKGKNLRLTAPDQTVTARDRIEYRVANGKLDAIGNAVAMREGDKLEADRISAIFTKDSKGKRTLKQLDAKNNVKITTPTEVLTGDNGTYQADTSLAEIIGNVKITRGPNILEGEKAQLDLKTNISKMFGSADGNGRVRGVFYPGSETPPATE
ncbi:MAG: ostA-like family protein [Alphaproteobacteria bacterium]|nr:ostA-like family protein [Alphaproteobacteria bacterium]